jgi:hypothetical protein
LGCFMKLSLSTVTNKIEFLAEISGRE